MHYQSKIIKSLEWRFCEPDPEIKAFGSKKITSSKIIYDIFRPLIKSLTQEIVMVVCLSASNTIMAYETISKGVLNVNILHPREIFRIAISSNCNTIILIHNHPSGNLNPSINDIEATKTVLKSGEIIGIPLLDHIIMTDEDYYSFQEEGRM